MLVNAKTKYLLIATVLLLNIFNCVEADANLNKQKFQERKMTLLYNSQRMRGLYSNTKNLLRITNIPPEIDEVQISHGNPIDSNLTIIGKRNREVVIEPGAEPYVEFKFLTGANGGKEHLFVKYFDKDEYEDTFKVVNTSKIPVNIRDCAKDVPNPLCARPLVAVKCGLNCYDFVPGKLTNYENFCEMNAAEAKLFAKGACPIETSPEEELAELKEL